MLFILLDCKDIIFLHYNKEKVSFFSEKIFFLRYVHYFAINKECVRY